jgi:serine/threonine protein kinase
MQIGREVRILSSLDHPNIARLLEVIEDDTSISLVLERCWGGELYDFINQLTFPGPGTRSWQDACTGLTQPPQTVVAVTEVHIAKMVRQILLAINYMHSRKVVHRDLKPENLMLLMPFAQNQEPMIKVLSALAIMTV